MSQPKPSIVFSTSSARMKSMEVTRRSACANTLGSLRNLPFTNEVQVELSLKFVFLPLLRQSTRRDDEHSRICCRLIISFRSSPVMMVFPACIVRQKKSNIGRGADMVDCLYLVRQRRRCCSSLQKGIELKRGLNALGPIHSLKFTGSPAR